MDVISEQYSFGQLLQVICSVVFKFFQDFGGVYLFIWYKVFNYNFVILQFIIFDMLFVFGIMLLDSIYFIVQCELVCQIGFGVVILFLIGFDLVYYQNFVIIDDSLIFYFVQGELLLLFVGVC